MDGVRRGKLIAAASSVPVFGVASKKRTPPSIEIRALSAATLSGAMALGERVFPGMYSGWSFRASLDPVLLARSQATEKDAPVDLRYWVALDPKTHKVIGTVGLYTEVADAGEAIWLGWFCVDPAARGRGVGSQLLDFAIGEARLLGRKYLRLYTSTAPNEAAAQPLYESRGLIETHRGKPGLHSGIQNVYRQVDLRG